MENTVTNPPVIQPCRSVYTYAERIALAIIAQLAKDDVLNAEVIDSYGMDIVMSNIAEVIDAFVREMSGNDQELEMVLRHAARYEAREVKLK